MMLRICDRCGEPIKGATPYGSVTVYEGPLPPKAADLCLPCLSTLRLWLQPKEATQ